MNGSGAARSKGKAGAWLLAVWMGAWMAAWLTSAGGCVGPEQSAAGAQGQQEAAQRPAPEEDAALPSLRLAAADSSVRTVQLYAGEDERRLPVLPLGAAGATGGGAEGSGARLVLEFDLLERQGRPLSVYFYHADREWQRDPAPPRFLDGFRSGDLLDYDRARSGGVPYVHYTYAFPTRDVGFKASGNYILRVTEQGQEEEVLFERPFFVTEGGGALELDFEEIGTGALSGRSDRPVALYRPPPGAGTNPFDFSTCFVPGGRLRRGRCVAEPSLSEQPALTFELPYREGFALGTGDYFLDLSRLQAGGEVVSVDRQATPAPLVVLEADRAGLSEAGRAPLLNGQPVVRGAGLGRADPELSAEYVSVRFRFVPPEGQRLGGPLVVDGSFHDGPLEEAPRLQWRPSEGYYAADVLLKQGLYEYRYTSPDAQTRARLSENVPPLRRRYATFVYYRDASLGSDRLLTVREVQVE